MRSVPRSYYRKANGALVVYDTTDEASFGNVRRWVSEMEWFGTAALCVETVC